MLKTVRLIAIIVIAINFSACGFALRGANKGDTVPGTTMYVQAAQANAELAQELNAALQQAQMHIVNTPQQAQYVLSVGAENFVSRTSTVNGRARAAQYDLQLSVEVSLASSTTSLLTNEALSVTRSYFEDTANIAGSTQEIEILRQEMRRELVEQMLRRLRAAAQNP